MKKIRLLSLCVAAGLLLTGCKAVPVLKGDFTVGTDIRQEDVTEFYYTYENINFNASYLRYRFYTEDGGYFFYHERRERPDDYGPTTEEDIVSSGTVKLTEAQWGEFFELLKAYRSLEFFADQSKVYNPTAIPVELSIFRSAKEWIPVKVLPGQTVDLD